MAPRCRGVFADGCGLHSDGPSARLWASRGGREFERGVQSGAAASSETREWPAPRRRRDSRIGPDQARCRVAESRVSLESHWFVEFDITDEVRFARLVRIVTALAKAKAHQGDSPLRAAAFEQFLDEEARVRSARAAIDSHGEVEALEAARARGEEYIFRTDSGRDWCMDAIISAVSGGEYDILPMTRSGSVARLHFEPHAGPCGGTEALAALIRLFGQRVVREVGW